MLKKLFTLFMLWRTLLLDIVIATGGVKNRKLIYEDLQRIGGLPFNKVGLLRLNYALLTQKSFRAVFYFRYKKNPLSILCKLFISSQDQIEIRCSQEMGGGYSPLPQYGPCDRFVFMWQ